MTKSLLILLGVVVILVGCSVTTMAMGFADFVAVADRPGSAMANPAGLANLTTSALDLEHRFTDRDEWLMDYDDVLIYTAPGNPGYGALFYAYSQDLAGAYNPALYWRTTSYGYAYGWRVTDQVNLGLTLKGVNLGLYDSGTLTQQSYDSGVFLDFGVQLKLDEHFQIGLAVHNIGRNLADPFFNYATAAGVAYHSEKFVVALELNDYLNEGGSPIYRLGGRYEISAAVRPWGYFMIAENGHIGGSLGLEYQNGKHLKLDISWFTYHDDFQNIDSLKTMVGYRF